MHKMGRHLLLARPSNWQRFIIRVVSDFDLIFTRASAIRSASVTDKTLLLMLLYLSDGGASWIILVQEVGIRLYWLNLLHADGGSFLQPVERIILLRNTQKLILRRVPGTKGDRAGRLRSRVREARFMVLLEYCDTLLDVLQQERAARVIPLDRRVLLGWWRYLKVLIYYFLWLKINHSTLILTCGWCPIIRFLLLDDIWRIKIFLRLIELFQVQIVQVLAAMVLWHSCWKFRACQHQ